MSEREEVKPIECDCCGGTWGDINADGEHDNVWTCVHELTQQRDTMRRERDEARRERDDAIIEKRLSDEQRARWMTENVALVHRAERAQAEASYIRRVFRGAIESDALAVTYKTVGSYRAGLLKTINALDTAEGAP